jgi:parallel beta-helix repeat protein
MMMFTELDSRDSEALSGGWRLTKTDTTKYSFNTTRLTQGNTVSNNGIGVLLGGGFANSLQGNAFELGSVIS